MKHLISILCLVILCITGTQNAQAQTKEETIQWLNAYTNGLIHDSYGYQLEKIKDNGDMVLIWIDSESRRNLFTFNLKDDFWLEDIWLEYEMDYNMVKFVPKEEFKLEDFGYGRWVIRFYCNDKESATRVYNAITHLAKLLGAKPRPKADTF